MMRRVTRNKLIIRNVCMNPAKHVFLLLVATIILGGCVRPVGPDYERPEFVTNDQWHQQLVAGMDTGEAAYQSWWIALGDPQLNSLIERATAQNLDIRIAAARINESRALLGIAAGERFPDVDGSGSASRQQLSQGSSGAPVGGPQNATAVGIGATWELDLWGRVSRTIEVAAASYEASIENYRDVQVVLYADIGSNYVELRKLQQRLRYARENIEAQRKTLDIVAARYKAELAPKLDLRQAELNHASTEASIPRLEIAILQTINRLSVLLGQAPGALRAKLMPIGDIPALPQALAVGIPADLARRRPDVRRAERNLAAQTASIGVATSALYPNFFISGDFGYATVGGELVATNNETWGVAGLFSWNLFDGGRVRNAIRVQEARTEQLLAAYEQTVLRSLQDVEDSLIGFAEERKRVDSLVRAEAASLDAVTLVNELYKRGLTDFQNVLDTERTLFVQQDELAQSRGDVALNLISIYRALGGGWSAGEELL